MKPLFAFSRLAAGRGRSATGRRSRRRIAVGLRRARLELLESRQMLSWTVMAYIDGDDDGGGDITQSLVAQIPGNFAEMAASGSTADVKVVVQVDSIGWPTVFGGEKGARRGLVQTGDTLSTAWGTRLGNVDSGDPQSVIRFVQWATENYPADNYALVLWNHGHGHDGVCWDSTSKTHLSIMDLTQVMNAIGHLDVLAFDACLMGMVEVARQFSGEADVMVASEEFVPGAGYDYRFLSQLVATPTMNAATLANHIVQYYGAYYTVHDARATLAAIDLSKIGTSTTALEGALETFADTMIASATQSDWTALATARNASFKYGYWNTRNRPFPSHDVIEMMTRLRGVPGVSSSVVTAAGNVISAVTASVLSCWAGSRVTANGLSIYSPAPGDRDASAAYTYDLSFLVDTQWIDVAYGTAPRRAPGVRIGVDPRSTGQTAMFVYGTDGPDEFTLEQLSGGRVYLETSMPGWSGTYSPPARGFIARVYVYGYGGNDAIAFENGTFRPAVVFGGAGNDNITGGQGNDVLHGGPGDDLLNGGEGNDAIAGGDGNDRLYGQQGNDRLCGGEGNDTVIAGSGNDLLFGAGGADALWGDQGNDWIIGGLGTDQLTDAGGANRLLGGAGNDRLWTGPGRDVLYGGPDDDVLLAGAGDDWLYGGDENDRLEGQAGNDILLGEAGNDRLLGGLGRNLLVGGLDIDQLFASGGGDILIGGVTLYDVNDAALAAIMAEWTSSTSLAARIKHLDGRLGGGRNRGFLLRTSNPRASVFTDSLANGLYGNAAADWILSFASDQVHPRA